MSRAGPAGDSFENVMAKLSGGEIMTLAKLRHDIRNHLNSIKLSSALLQRQRRDAQSEEPLREIDRSADRINELITRFMGDADAPSLLHPLQGDQEQRRHS